MTYNELRKSLFGSKQSITESWKKSTRAGGKLTRPGRVEKVIWQTKKDDFGSLNIDMARVWKKNIRDPGKVNWGKISTRAGRIRGKNRKTISKKLKFDLSNVYKTFLKY